MEPQTAADPVTEEGRVEETPAEEPTEEKKEEKAETPETPVNPDQSSQ